MKISHHFRQKDAILEINKRLNSKYDKEYLRNRLTMLKNGKLGLNDHCFQAILNKLKWKLDENNYHHYSTLTKTHSYSESAITEIIKKITTIDHFLENAKIHYKKKTKRRL